MRGGMEVVRAQWRVILALMLHDIRTRMGGSAVGYITISIAWPLVHIALVLTINAGLGRSVPYGDSAALWFATGVVPFLAFQYTARGVMLGILSSRPLFSFPVMTSINILFARAILEIINVGIVVVILLAIFVGFDIDCAPRQVAEASFALLSMILLGLGWGSINSIFAAAFPFWINVFFLTQMALWFGSGIFFVPDFMPEALRHVLSYIPPLQGVQWTRSAYYEGFGSSTLSKSYLISCGIMCLFFGLCAERYIRGKIR